MSKSLSSRQTLALAALLAMSTSASAAEYSIEPIWSPSGGSVFPSSIASNGLVVGNGANASSKYCFKYLDGVFTTLPLPPNTLRCEGAVTDLFGNITMKVVPTDNPNTTRLVELTTKGNFRPLTGLSADGNTVAASKGGRMAGSSLSATGEPQAYLFSRTGAGVNVGALTGMTRSWLTGLNAKGWAVGEAQNAGSNLSFAFRYKDGKILWLSSLTEGGTSRVKGINASGTMVGYSESVINDFWSNRAVTWQGKSAPVSLGTLFGQGTYGAAINASGVVAGYFGFGANGMRVRNGVAESLYSLLTPEQQTQWPFVGMATAINDDGLIAGTGGSNTAYLLRPLP